MTKAYDLTNFVTYTPAVERRNRRNCPQPYLLFSSTVNKGGFGWKNQAQLTLPRWLTEIALELYGKKCDVLFEPESRCLALKSGDTITISRTRDRDGQGKISLSYWYYRFLDAYGSHKRVFFETDIYENDVLILTPTGEVNDA